MKHRHIFDASRLSVPRPTGSTAHISDVTLENIYMQTEAGAEGH